MNDIELKDIITNEFIEQFQDSFAYATGFGVVFVDLDGNHIGEGSNFTPYCTEINKSEEGASYCAETNKKAIQLAIETRKPSIYVCHAGLVNIEVPIIYDGKCIGAFTAGNVLCSDMDSYPRDNELCTIPWLETDEAKEYFRKIKVLTNQQIESTAKALENMTNYIIQNIMYNKLQENLAEERMKTLEYQKVQIEMEHQLKLANLDALQKQVTPHFIFNVLGSVSRLISLKNYSVAKDMIDCFSEMLRYSISNISTVITLEQELAYIQNYLSIQKIRFSDRLVYSIVCDDDMLNLRIPYFSLQPLIENAIEHGLLSQVNGGELRLTCSSDNGNYLIKIMDNGKGMSDTEVNDIRNKLHDIRNLSNKNVGIKNSFNRFKLLFENRVDYSIESKLGIGTCITIKITKEGLA